MRHVRGSLFRDYVRMIRAQKHVNWQDTLPAADVAYLTDRIDLDAWYPMASFERLGLAILGEMGANMEAVRLWGRMTVGQLCDRHPALVAGGDPLESLMRFQVLRSSLFDFDAFHFEAVSPGDATLVIRYHMSDTAEKAASYQALGFFEEVLNVSGATAVKAEFASRSWDGDDRTVLRLRWES